MKSWRRIVIWVVLVVSVPGLMLTMGLAGCQRPATSPTSVTNTSPTLSSSPPGSSTTTATGTPLSVTIAQNMEVPWALDFLPDGSIIFSERPGRIRLIDSKEGLLAQPLLTIDEVSATGEGGLLGIAAHPNYPQNHFIYVYYTYQPAGGLTNRVVRFRLDGRSLVDRTVIIDGITAGSIHDGGRIKFGPDGLLYIAVGDGGVADRAQDKNSLNGKILRIRDDGGIPVDNPFPGSPVYSYGHRNPEGLAWDNQCRLWETEHGSSATDEVNLIVPGGNYGWPVVRGDQTATGMISPFIQSGSNTWAPSGLAYLKGSLYFAGLRGQSLYQVPVMQANPLALRRYLNGTFGRLREVVVGPDGLLYISTSNRDGRGQPAAEADQIIRIDPSRLQ